MPVVAPVAVRERLERLGRVVAVGDRLVRVDLVAAEQPRHRFHVGALDLVAVAGAEFFAGRAVRLSHLVSLSLRAVARRCAPLRVTRSGFPGGIGTVKTVRGRSCAHRHDQVPGGYWLPHQSSRPGVR